MCSEMFKDMLEESFSHDRAQNSMMKGISNKEQKTVKSD